MTGIRERVVWALGVTYLLAATALALGFIVLGYVLHLVPGVPAGAERWYAARVMGLLVAILRPIDRLPETEPWGAV